MSSNTVMTAANPSMGRRQRASVILLASLLVTLVSGGCRFATTDIGAIQAKPASYLTRQVTVSGDVTDSVKLPFLPGLYTLNDGTGEMHVVTNVQPPLSGARVRVRVRVESAATIGGSPVGLHLRELERY